MYFVKYKDIWWMKGIILDFLNSCIVFVLIGVNISKYSIDK